jgi:hypothetical protein
VTWSRTYASAAGADNVRLICACSRTPTSVPGADAFVQHYLWAEGSPSLQPLALPFTHS